MTGSEKVCEYVTDTGQGLTNSVEPVRHDIISISIKTEPVVFSPMVMIRKKVWPSELD